MEKLVLTVSLIGLTAGAYAQGQINLSNISNSDTNLTASTGGLFWRCPSGGGGSAPTLMNTDFNVNFYGGSDSNSLVLLKSLVNSGGGAAAGPGTFLDLSGQPVSIPGATTSAFFLIQAWIGSSVFQSGTFIAQSPVFSNPLGVAGTPTDFTGMPAIILSDLVGVCVPEPSTFALASIGATVFLIFRRRASVFRYFGRWWPRRNAAEG